MVQEWKEETPTIEFKGSAEWKSGQVKREREDVLRRVGEADVSRIWTEGWGMEREEGSRDGIARQGWPIVRTPHRQDRSSIKGMVGGLVEVIGIPKPRSGTLELREAVCAA